MTVIEGCSKELSSRGLRFLGAAVLMLVCGCASAPKERVEAAPANASPVGGEAHGDLVGDWVEYWALSGNADTQRYSLRSDGRFEWHAPRAGTTEVRVRRGRYELSAQGVELRVETEELRSPCEGSGDGPCVRTVDPAHTESLAVDGCPPNEEARALDASYRCISLGGRVFWRRAEAH